MGVKVNVCIGSACHLKGSYDVINELRRLVEEKNLADDVELAGRFCLGNCVNGVSVQIDDQIYSVSPETAPAFFEEQVVSRL